MPRPRFDKLPTEKRDQLMQIAAKEFAAFGYEGASLNKILDQAGISKGAAYYYFDDKADLFLTVIRYYSTFVFDHAQLATLTSDTFWPTIQRMYHDQFMSLKTHPWEFGTMYAARSLTREARTEERLGRYYDEIMAWVTAIIVRGQELAVIRSDMPTDLLVLLLVGFDRSLGAWLTEHEPGNAQTEADRVITQAVDMMPSMFAPT